MGGGGGGGCLAGYYFCCCNSLDVLVVDMTFSEGHAVQ